MDSGGIVLRPSSTGSVSQHGQASVGEHVTAPCDGLSCSKDRSPAIAFFDTERFDALDDGGGGREACESRQRHHGIRHITHIADDRGDLGLAFAGEGVVGGDERAAHLLKQVGELGVALG